MVVAFLVKLDTVCIALLWRLWCVLRWARELRQSWMAEGGIPSPAIAAFATTGDRRVDSMFLSWHAQWSHPYETNPRNHSLLEDFTSIQDYFGGCLVLVGRGEWRIPQMTTIWTEDMMIPSIGYHPPWCLMPLRSKQSAVARRICTVMEGGALISICGGKRFGTECSLP